MIAVGQSLLLEQRFARSGVESPQQPPVVKDIHAIVDYHCSIIARQPGLLRRRESLGMPSPWGRKFDPQALGDRPVKDLVYSGPLYKSMTIEGGKIRLSFAHAWRRAEVARRQAVGRVRDRRRGRQVRPRRGHN